MEFRELIESFSKKIGETLHVDDGGACALAIDDMEVTIQLVDEARSLVFFGRIGAPPPQGLEALLMAMLDANHLFKGTGGGTISHDAETGDFYLCRAVPLDQLDLDAFVAQFEKFVNVLELWQRLLADYRPQEGGADRPDDNLELSGFMAV